MGIFTYLKLGVAAFIILVCLYLVWNYRHMQAKIADLKDQNAALELGQQVIMNAQVQAQKTRQKVQIIVRKAQDENTAEQQDEMAGNDSALDARLERFYGVRGESKGGSAPRGGRGSSGYAAP